MSEGRGGGPIDNGSLFDAHYLSGYMHENGLGRFSANGLLSRILATKPGIVYVFALKDNHTLFVSRGVTSILGYPVEEVSQDPGFFMRITHPEDIAGTDDRHRWIMGLDDDVVFERGYRMRHRDGHFVHIHCREAVFARDASGVPALVIGSATDTTKAVEAEKELLARTEELKRSEESHRLLVETSVDAIVSVDSDMRINVWNPAAEKMFGYTAEEIMGESLLKIVPETLREKKSRGFDLFSRTGTGEVLGGVRELVGLHSDGSHIDLEISIAPMQVEGRWTATGIMRDISERKRVQRRRNKMDAEMQRIQRLDAIGVLAGGIAHDFNNILSSVLGNISMAQEIARGRAGLEELLAQSEEAVIQARELAGQLLTFSEGGEPVREVVDIGHMVERGCRFSLAGSSSSFHLDLEPDLYVLADGGQISQMVGNLVLNASQAMDGGGEVRVRAYRTEMNGHALPGMPVGDYVAVEVEDAGPGIPEDCAEKIFNPFFTTRKEGHGLGLSVCYSIARQHGGTIAVESEPGVGALFRVLLPLAERPSSQGQEYTGGDAPEGSRILLMDDDEDVRKVMRQMLESLEMDVTEATEGQEAIEIYDSALESGERFDLLIMDLTIAGGMGGAEAMRRILSIDPHVTAIVSSGYSNDPVMARYDEHGFAGVLRKPFTLKELRRALEETLGRAAEG